MTRGGFRGRRVPGGAFGGVFTGMSLASRRAWATRAVVSEDISSPVKARSKPDVSLPTVRYARRWLRCTVVLRVLGTGVVSGPMSTRTARLTIGTALELGKTFLALLQRKIVTFVLTFAFVFDLCPLPLLLNRRHATIATASNCRASANASSASGSSPEVLSEGAKSVSWISSSSVSSCSPS